MSIWRLQLIGEVKVTGLGQEIKRFESKRAIALLAYLVLNSNYSHQREVLVDRIWPDADPVVGRNRLKQALASLRRLLEPPILAPGTVFYADKHSIQVRIESIDCDLLEILASNGATFVDWQRDADLLPGFYDEWLDGFRTRYDSLRINAFDEESNSRPITQSIPRTDTENRLEKIGVQPEIRTFIGRKHETNEFLELTKSERIVTMLGIGGIGKTSLANHIGLIEKERRVVFVSFAGTNDLSFFYHVIGQRMGIVAQDAKRLKEAVVQALALEPTLLILDNMEQFVASPLKDILEALLSEAKLVYILLTSRVALGIGGTFKSLKFLDLPNEKFSLDALAELDCTRLFVERARKSKVDFQLTVRNADAMQKLLMSLGGHPLAIELCASWVPLFSLSDIVKKLDHSELTLASKSSSIESRHSSFDQVLGTSFQLLSSEAKRLLVHAAALQGEFSYELLFVIQDAPEIIDALSELISVGYIHTVEHDADIRYRLPQALFRFLNHYQPIAEDLAKIKSKLDNFILTFLKSSRSLREIPQLGLRLQTEYVQFIENEWETIWNSLQRIRQSEPNLAIHGWLDCLWFWSARPENQVIYHELLEASKDDRLEPNLRPICETLGLLSYQLSTPLMFVLDQLEDLTQNQVSEGSLAWAECAVIRARLSIKLFRRLDQSFALNVADYWSKEQDTFREIFMRRMFVNSFLIFEETERLLPIIDSQFSKLSKSNWNLLLQDTKFDRAQYFFYAKEYDRAAPIFESIVEWGEQNANTRLITLSTSFLASCASVNGRVNEAVVLFARTALLYRELNDFVAMSLPIWNLADHLIQIEKNCRWGALVLGVSVKMWRHWTGTDLPQQDIETMTRWMEIAKKHISHEEAGRYFDKGLKMSLQEIVDLMMRLESGLGFSRDEELAFF